MSTLQNMTMKQYLRLTMIQTLQLDFASRLWKYQDAAMQVLTLDVSAASTKGDKNTGGVSRQNKCAFLIMNASSGILNLTA